MDWRAWTAPFACPWMLLMAHPWSLCCCCADLCAEEMPASSAQLDSSGALGCYKVVSNTSLKQRQAHTPSGACSASSSANLFLFILAPPHLLDLVQHFCTNLQPSHTWPRTTQHRDPAVAQWLHGVSFKMMSGSSSLTLRTVPGVLSCAPFVNVTAWWAQAEVEPVCAGVGECNLTSVAGGWIAPLASNV